jgi:hypothetical protein
MKERVLAAAESAIADLGFFGVSLREVAVRSGLEPGTVHGMFGGKRTLLLIADARLRARRGEGPSSCRVSLEPQPCPPTPYPAQRPSPSTSRP